MVCYTVGMSAPIPKPSLALEEAAKACSKTLRSCSFEGDYKGFQKAWQEYLQKHGEADPHGRLALSHVNNVATGLLSYQSVSTCRKESGRQTQARWELWMEVLPFDYQLNLVIDEYSPHLLNEIDFSWLKWEDWKRLGDSEELDAVFRQSSMGSWLSETKPGPASPKSSVTVNGKKGTETHHTALSPQAFQNLQQSKLRMMWGKLLSSKAWGRADEWLGASGFDVNSVMTKAWAHHEGPSSRGATQVMFDTPQPAWLSGVFVGASEPEFWTHLAKAGGPASAASALAQLKDNLGDVLGLFRPAAILQDAARDRILETTAQWRRQTLEAVWAAAPRRSKPIRF